MSRLNALASRPEPEFPVLSRLLWQALALGALVSLALLALPLAPGGASAFGFLPFWLLAAPAAALLTLHRRGVRSHFLSILRKIANDSARKCSLTPVSRPRGQITFPQAVTANPVAPRGKCALTPFPQSSRGRRASSAQAA